MIYLIFFTTLLDSINAIFLFFELFLGLPLVIAIDGFKKIKGLSLFAFPLLLTVEVDSSFSIYILMLVMTKNNITVAFFYRYSVL